MASLQTTLKISKYTQIHRVPGDIDTIIRAAKPMLINKDAAPFDVVDEYSFDSSMEDFIKTIGDIQAAWKPLLDLEASVIDPSGSHISFVYEQPQVMKDPYDNVMASPYNHILRIHVFAEMRDNDAAYEHWSAEHGPIVRRWAASSGVHKYVQNHPRNSGRISPVLDAIRKERGVDTSSTHTWYASCWVEDNLLSRADPIATRATLEIDEDEQSGWMKHGTMNWMIGKDYIFVDKHRA